MGNIINGHNLRIKIGGVAVAKATECSLSISGETRDTAHKDIGTGTGAGWAGAEYGTKSWEMSGTAYFSFGDSFEGLFNPFNGSTKVTVEFSDGVTGNKKFTGTGVLTALDISAPNNEESTYNYSIKGDGPIVMATIA
jgi:predicted secreted protein